MYFIFEREFRQITFIIKDFYTKGTKGMFFQMKLKNILLSVNNLNFNLDIKIIYNSVYFN